MFCVDCGRLCSGTRCRECHRSHNDERRKVYDQSEVILTNGYWENDGGIMRWRSQS